MKNLKGRRFIIIFLIIALLSFIVAILVSIISSLLFFNKNDDVQNNSELALATEITANTEFQTEISLDTEENLKETQIETTIAVEYSNKMIAFYSPISCYIQFSLYVTEDDSNSFNQYGPIELVSGEKKILSLDNLSSLKYSDNAKITNVSNIHTFVYGKSSFDSSFYSISDSNIEFKCYSDKIELSSNKDCLASFVIQTKDGNVSGFIQTTLLKLDANISKTVTLDDLAPGFYSGTTEIYSYSPLTIHGYEKNN